MVAEKAMKDKEHADPFFVTPKIYTGDVDYPYRQENDLYYLTALKQNGATLVMTKNGADVRSFLFIPKCDPAQETWTGRTYTNEEAAKISGIKTILDSELFGDFILSIKNKKLFSTRDNSFANMVMPETIYLLSGLGDRAAMEFPNTGMRRISRNS